MTVTSAAAFDGFSGLKERFFLCGLLMLAKGSDDETPSLSTANCAPDSEEPV